MKRRTKLGESWVAHRRDMRESPAWGALSDNGRRLLDRIELEHMRHGGGENGKLICTYTDFEQAGLRRASVARAIRECELLGFLVVKRAGYRSARSLRPPNVFCLTYVEGCGESPASTHAWRRVMNEVQAWALVREAAGHQSEEPAVSAAGEVSAA